MLRYISLIGIAALGLCQTNQAQDVRIVLDGTYGSVKESIDPIEVVEDYSIRYAATINASELKEHLMIIASDEFEGRETGMPGQKKAAEYIANYFEGLGIKGYDGDNYFQEYPLKRQKYTSTVCSINGRKFNFVDDFYFFGSSVNRNINLSEVSLAGYGIKALKWDDYDGIDVKGKAVMVLTDIPRNKKGVSKVSDEEMEVWAGDWRMKVEEARARGVKELIMVNQDYDSYMSRVKYYLENPGMSILSDSSEDIDTDDFQVFFVSPDMANALLSDSKNKSVKKYKKRINKGKSPKQRIISSTLDLALEYQIENFTGENVLAFIEGTDLKEEIVVVTAHYDHIGRKGDEINNGADDDGSGTVSALEIAEAFQLAKIQGNGPRRSVLVMTVSGEEKGLLGSRYYSDHPIYPLENTVANLNIDMIGRVDEAHADMEDYIYLIGSDKLSSDLHRISEKANGDYTNLALDYTYNDPNDPNKFYYRSDHYNFAKHGIPVIFYFSGVHEDYHKPTDTPDKIMYDKLEKVARLVFHTAWELANRDDAPVVDKVNEFEE